MHDCNIDNLRTKLRILCGNGLEEPMESSKFSYSGVVPSSYEIDASNVSLLFSLLYFLVDSLAVADSELVDCIKVLMKPILPEFDDQERLKTMLFCLSELGLILNSSDSIELAHLFRLSSVMEAFHGVQEFYLIGSIDGVFVKDYVNVINSILPPLVSSGPGSVEDFTVSVSLRSSVLGSFIRGLFLSALYVPEKFSSSDNLFKLLIPLCGQDFIVSEFIQFIEDSGILKSATNTFRQNLYEEDFLVEGKPLFSIVNILQSCSLSQELIFTTIIASSYKSAVQSVSEIIDGICLKGSAAASRDSSSNSSSSYLIEDLIEYYFHLSLKKSDGSPDTHTQSADLLSRELSINPSERKLLLESIILERMTVLLHILGVGTISPEVLNYVLLRKSGTTELSYFMLKSVVLLCLNPHLYEFYHVYLLKCLNSGIESPLKFLSLSKDTREGEFLKKNGLIPFSMLPKTLQIGEGISVLNSSILRLPLDIRELISHWNSRIFSSLKNKRSSQLILTHLLAVFVALIPSDFFGSGYYRNQLSTISSPGSTTSSYTPLDNSSVVLVVVNKLFEGIAWRMEANNSEDYKDGLLMAFISSCKLDSFGGAGGDKNAQTAIYRGSSNENIFEEFLRNDDDDDMDDETGKEADIIRQKDRFEEDGSLTAYADCLLHMENYHILVENMSRYHSSKSRMQEEKPKYYRFRPSPYFRAATNRIRLLMASLAPPSVFVLVTRLQLLGNQVTGAETSPSQPPGTKQLDLLAVPAPLALTLESTLASVEPLVRTLSLSPIEAANSLIPLAQRLVELLFKMPEFPSLPRAALYRIAGLTAICSCVGPVAIMALLRQLNKSPSASQDSTLFENLRFLDKLNSFGDNQEISEGRAGYIISPIDSIVDSTDVLQVLVLTARELAGSAPYLFSENEKLPGATGAYAPSIAGPLPWLKEDYRPPADPNSSSLDDPNFDFLNEKGINGIEKKKDEKKKVDPDIDVEAEAAYLQEYIDHERRAAEKEISNLLSASLVGKSAFLFPNAPKIPDFFSDLCTNFFFFPVLSSLIGVAHSVESNLSSHEADWAFNAEENPFKSVYTRASQDSILITSLRNSSRIWTEFAEFAGISPSDHAPQLDGANQLEVSKKNEIDRYLSLGIKALAIFLEEIDSTHPHTSVLWRLLLSICWIPRDHVDAGVREACLVALDTAVKKLGHREELLFSGSVLSIWGNMSRTGHPGFGGGAACGKGVALSDESVDLMNISQSAGSGVINKLDNFNTQDAFSRITFFSPILDEVSRSKSQGPFIWDDLLIIVDFLKFTAEHDSSDKCRSIAEGILASETLRKLTITPLDSISKLIK